MFEVTILDPDGAILKRLELYGSRPLRIGRAKECDIRLPIPAVSRIHAELVPLDEAGSQWVMRDLGSTHGLSVNGRRTPELTIEPGLEVQLGPARLRFENLSSRIGAELDRLLGEEDDDDSPVTSRDIRIIGTRPTHLDETLTD